MAALLGRNAVATLFRISAINTQLTRHAAGGALGKKLKKGGAIGAAGPARKFLDVEEDVKKLVTTCVGANIYKEGSDPVLKADSEYPEWLWTLRTDREVIPLEEMDQDSWEYWERLQKMHRRQKNKLIAVRIKYKLFGRPPKLIE